MSYTKTLGEVPSWGISEEAKAAIALALDAGKRVEWEFSSFSDSGPDWQQVLIEGLAVPGSFSEGF